MEQEIIDKLDELLQGISSAEKKIEDIYKTLENINKRPCLIEGKEKIKNSEHVIAT